MTREELERNFMGRSWLDAGAAAAIDRFIASAITDIIENLELVAAHDDADRLLLMDEDIVREWSLKEILAERERMNVGDY